MLDYLKIRRDLHQIPEIGLEEYKTHAYLMRVINGLTAGLDFVEIRTWRTGILVFIKGSSPDKTIGWRTDMMDSANSLNAASSKNRRGCSGSGEIFAIAMSFRRETLSSCLAVGSNVSSIKFVGINDSNPLPRPFFTC